VNSTVTIEEYKVNEVVVGVTADREGLLVLSDTYYPGWRAFVDGAETEILQANVCQRAVEISPGKHKVRFVFDSTPVKAGFGISVLSLLAAGGILFMVRWKS
jgi:uncharacterized membrane protein YfhO